MHTRAGASGRGLPADPTIPRTRRGTNPPRGALGKRYQRPRISEPGGRPVGTVLCLLQSLGRAFDPRRTGADARNGRTSLARSHGPAGLLRDLDRAPRFRRHLLSIRRFCRRPSEFSEDHRTLRSGAPCRFRQPVRRGSPRRSGDYRRPRIVGARESGRFFAPSPTPSRQAML